ncbi:hypothetical protein B0H21DRAFT_99601 [Amylocystis lapponica]|nr:hypothetical protein B0H21DRAFT_99601 [Amylocystis lapponica]
MLLLSCLSVSVMILSSSSCTYVASLVSSLSTLYSHSVRRSLLLPFGMQPRGLCWHTSVPSRPTTGWRARPYTNGLNISDCWPGANLNLQTPNAVAAVCVCGLLGVRTITITPHMRPHVGWLIFRPDTATRPVIGEVSQQEHIGGHLEEGDVSNSLDHLRCHQRRIDRASITRVSTRSRFFRIISVTLPSLGLWEGSVLLCHPVGACVTSREGHRLFFARRRSL